MKKLFLLSALLGVMQLSALAQDDDMYFVPTKKNVASQRANYGVPSGTYYSGSSRSVDDYNRWGSSYEVLPTDTGDIISFAPVEGTYPDSLGDFRLTQQMARFDGYEPSTAYWDGYAQGRRDNLYAWHSPWYYSSYYPWYDSWYWDPWYYGGYWGWHDPWYFGSYWGWGGYYSRWYSYYPHHYYGGGGYVSHRYPGTENHGRITGSGGRGFAGGRTHTYSAGTFGSSRNGGFGGARTSGTYGGSRTSTTTRTRTVTPGSRGGTYTNSNGNFGGSRSSSSGSTYTPSRASSSSSGSGGGSFGGSRSSGGGGGRSGGGFGSGRR